VITCNKYSRLSVLGLSAIILNSCKIVMVALWCSDSCDDSFVTF